MRVTTLTMAIALADKRVAEPGTVTIPTARE
jgi:hypothetical protein